jgi:hypothetical protein
VISIRWSDDDRPDRKLGPLGDVDRVGDRQLLGVEPEQQHRQRGEVGATIDRHQRQHAGVAVVAAGDPERLGMADKAEDRLARLRAEHRIEFARRLRGWVARQIGEEQFDRGKARGFVAGAGKFEGERDRDDMARGLSLCAALPPSS